MFILGFISEMDTVLEFEHFIFLKDGNLSNNNNFFLNNIIHLVFLGSISTVVGIIELM